MKTVTPEMYEVHDAAMRAKTQGREWVGLDELLASLAGVVLVPTDAMTEAKHAVVKQWIERTSPSRLRKIADAVYGRGWYRAAGRRR
jgi:hypothetical protein